tara:strand:+ start:192 stop:830 length:639 start_codon:yes stop_codon:yes gene_type:complete
MKEKIFIPIADNGMGLSRTSWAISMFALGLSKVLDKYEVIAQGISYPYPDGVMNISTADFLESGAERMLVIDTDEIFNPSHVEILMSHDLPFVSGIYPKKKVGLEFPIMPLESNLTPFADGQPVPVEVARCARGFLNVHRSVFEEMKSSVSKYVDAETGREQWEFWKKLPGGHSEDFEFCDRYRQFGGKVMVDKRCTAQHEGSCVYPIKGTY